MVDYQSRIKDLEDEIKKTPYNKATQHHIGRVKAQIARLKQQDEERQARSGGSGLGYAVRRSGDATVIILGFPSSGKSTLLNALTNADSEVAAYAFTTLTVIPGLLDYKGAQIQVLDVPGIVAGAASGRGRGREVLATMRNADLCIVLLDGSRPSEFDVIFREAYDANIRLNRVPPDVKIVKKAKDGLSIGRTVRTPELTNDMVRDILSAFRIFNADVVIRSRVSADEFIDVVEGNKKYMPSLLVVNKVDLLSDSQRLGVERLLKPDVFISASQGVNIDALKELIFQRLGFMRLWMKEPGKDADLDEPLIVLAGSTIRDVARKIHRDFERKFKYARITGPSAKFANQKKGLSHVLLDDDVVELHMN